MSHEDGPVIMLLDDDEMWLYSLRRLLIVCGNARCLCFTEPETALEAIEHDERPDACVIEFKLAVGWDGARFARAIRERLGGHAPALILVSEAVVSDSFAGPPFDGAYAKSTEPWVLVEELLRFAELNRGHMNSRSRLTPEGRRASAQRRLSGETDGKAMTGRKKKP